MSDSLKRKFLTFYSRYKREFDEIQDQERQKYGRDKPRKDSKNPNQKNKIIRPSEEITAHPTTGSDKTIANEGEEAGREATVPRDQKSTRKTLGNFSKSYKLILVLYRTNNF